MVTVCVAYVERHTGCSARSFDAARLDNPVNLFSSEGPARGAQQQYGR